MDQKPRQYEHPIAIMGAGMGGMLSAIDLLKRGRSEFVIFERCDGFGGTTWRETANKTTKLQTEKGTYHADYMDPTEQVDCSLKTWPSRDALLEMFCKAADKHGLPSQTRFSTSIQKVEVKGDPLAGGYYDIEIQHDASEHFRASALISCPGVFYLPTDLKLPGKESFGGYITHGSYDSIKIEKLKDEVVVVLGHGGFAIENVRTCVEYKAKKIMVVSRRRHLAGPKVVSWLVSRSPVPIPGQVVVDAFQVMYGTTGFDVWSHPGVATNAERSHAIITQSTTFGVTDIYFLALQYGLCEIVEDEIQKLSDHCVHLNSGKSFQCGVIMKCLGSQADPDFDDLIGLQQVTGFWANGSPLLPILTVSKGVQARNFGGFSLGPAYAAQIKVNNWFLDFPEAFASVKDALPKKKRGAGDECTYVLSGGHVLTTMMVVAGGIPWIAAELGEMDKLKAMKTQAAHPQEEFLAECVGEWEMYIDMMKENGQIPADAPRVPYPYTAELVEELISKSEAAVRAEEQQRQAKMKAK
ncbi:unnamed protein product [Polarella glacialis]|uniref:FAD/NAD(P)-binding domain-containing protein n=1 Tax=Polarella glacialis TaxID=89957 RepID=A0A813HUF7_POLGL|nr:unnamed protein product [Polarella glacialis]